MKNKELLERLNDIHPLTQPARDELELLFEDKIYKKNEYLVREGSRPTNCNILINGVVRVYYLKEGSDYNKTFFTDYTFPTPLTALLSNSPAELNFQALTDCSVVQFDYQKFRLLFKKYRCLESFLLAVLENEWIKKEKHDIQMVTNDATTNYLIFRKTYPGLEQLIPQYHIASHLGITPIQLSRIRAQLIKAN